MIDEDELPYHPARALELLLPGLLGPWPELTQAVPYAPYLQRFLAAATHTPPTPSTYPNDLDGALCGRFGVPASPLGDWPLGAITAKADAQRRPEDGAWLRADPVYLRPDARALTLIDCRQNPVRGAEMDAMAADFNAHFADDGLYWESTLPGRGVLRVTGKALATLADLQTTPVWRVQGRDIHPHLPAGPAGRQWNRWLTETQLLFHAHPINQQREEAGKAPINSLWFWGSGPLPQHVQAPAEGLYGETVGFHGLCRLAGVEHSPVPDHAGDWFDQSLEESTGLMATDDFLDPWRAGDFAAWRAQVQRWESQFFAPIYYLWRQGKLTTLVIDAVSGGRFVIDGTQRPAWWATWRRPKPLAPWLNH